MDNTYTITGQFTIDLKELGELVSPHIVTDNDNTEQRIGVNEVEEMIDNTLMEHDFSSVIEDVINYNYDFTSEDDVMELIRESDAGQMADAFESLRDDVTELENQIPNIMVTMNHQAQIMGMQAEIDFLHEKYMDLLERRIGYRVSNFVSNVRSLPARLWARVPKFSITRKDD